MQIMYNSKFVLLAILLMIVLSSCGSDDKITNGESILYYAELNVSRIHPPGGVIVMTDTISASFDSIYSPITSNKPCCSLNITCNSFTLQWQEGLQRHIYSDISIDGFLNLNGIYIFRLGSDQAVPAFEKSITFPTAEPWLTYPRLTNPATNTFDTVLISEGFTITWTGTSSETVELIVCDGSVSEYHPADTLVYIITENDGAVAVTADSLINLVPNNMYKIIMTIKNSEALISEGYDPRSRIIAQNHTFSYFYAK